MAFEQLAPELLVLVMQAMDSPRQVYNLISACPKCLQVFSGSSTLILNSVIEKSVPAETLRHALAVLHAPSKNELLSSRDSVEAFLNRCHSSSNEFELPTTRDDAVALCRLLQNVELFTDAIFRSALETPVDIGYRVMESRYGQVSKPSYKSRKTPKFKNKKRILGSPLLSDTERIRLQRGILRLELYCRCFPCHPGPDRQSIHSGADQFWLFLSPFLPWEVEEITCVYQYFVALMRTFVNEFEREFEAQVRKASRLHPLTFRLGDDPVESGRGLFNFAQQLGPYKLQLFSRRAVQTNRRFVDYFVSLGFDFLDPFIRGTYDERRDLVRANSSTMPSLRGFLIDALESGEFVEPDAALRARDTNGLSEKHEDDTSRSNKGYRDYNPHQHQVYLGMNNWHCNAAPLRELGYVFWDADRIRHPEMSSELRKAGEEHYGSYSDFFGESAEETVGARFFDAKLSRSQMEDLGRKFGGIPGDDD